MHGGRVCEILTVSPIMVVHLQAGAGTHPRLVDHMLFLPGQGVEHIPEHWAWWLHFCCLHQGAHFSLASAAILR